LISIDDYEILRKEFMMAFAEEEMKIEDKRSVYTFSLD
jgi:hypothetical protein